MNQMAIQMDVRPSRAKIGQRVAQSTLPIIKEALTNLVLDTFKDKKTTYAKVIQTVNDGAHELVDFLRAAVRFNTVVENVHDWAGWRGLADTDWKDRQALLPTLVLPETDQSLIDIKYNSFSFKLAVRSGTLENLLAVTAAAINNYLGELIERGMMGFLDYHEGETAAYSFIRRRIKVETEQIENLEDLGSQVGYRPENPLNLKTIYACRQTRWGTARYSTEEKVHYLRQTRVEPLQTYQGKLPIWLEPLKHSTPDWLSPHLRVMTGDIVEESVNYQDTETREWTLPDMKKVERASPAILLGTATLAGWSDADFGIDFDDRRDFEEFISPSVKSSPNKHQRKNSTQHGNTNLLPFLVGAAMLFLPFTWPVRIGMAIVGTATTLAAASKNKK